MMSTPSEASSPDTDIWPGNLCLLHVLDTHFLVEILHVDPGAIRVSFPAQDYPIEDMWIDLEFHDKTGCTRYHVKVFEAPGPGGQGLVLERPRHPVRTRHRETCRVPTDLAVRVRDQVHVRQHDARLVNISAGGALLRTTAPFAFGDTLEVTLTLPGEPAYTLMGQIIHTTTAEKETEAGDFFGLRFIGLDPDAARAVRRHVWNQLRKLHPAG